MVGKQEKDKRGREEVALQVQEETGLTQRVAQRLCSRGALPRLSPPPPPAAQTRGLSQLLLCLGHTEWSQHWEGCVSQGHCGFAPGTGWNLAIPTPCALCSARVEVTRVVPRPGLCSSSRAGKTAPWAARRPWGEHSLEVAPLWRSRKARGHTTSIQLPQSCCSTAQAGPFLGFCPFSQLLFLGFSCSCPVQGG